VILGIDPGLNGALAVVNDEGLLLDVYDTPTVETRSSSGKRRRLIDDSTLWNIVHEPRLASHHNMAFIELVHAMPGQGVVSMFTMGLGLGIWYGVLRASGISFDKDVTPQAWKKVMLAGTGKDKNAARVKCQQLWPSKADLFARVKDDGRADAALIAEYGRRLRIGSAVVVDR